MTSPTRSEGETCPMCGALPIDQVVSVDRQAELVSNRYTLMPSYPVRAELVEALRKGADQFDFYAREHAVKSDRALSAGLFEEAKSSAAKAKVNADFAARARAILSRAEECQHVWEASADSKAEGPPNEVRGWSRQFAGGISTHRCLAAEAGDAGGQQQRQARHGDR